MAAIRKQYQVLADSAQFVRAVSSLIAERLVNLIGPRYGSKIHSIPLGVDCDVTRTECCNRKLFVILTPAALMAHKGHASAVQACQILRERGVKNFEWIFCGDGPLLGAIHSQIASLDLDRQIKLLGNIPNDHILDLYARGAVDAVILPSIAINGMHEGIPHALMQAMSYRIPVASTDSGSTLELIGNGAGVFVPQRDPVALADAVMRLIGKPPWRLAQGEKGYDRVRENFNKRETTRRLMALFAQPNSVLHEAANSQLVVEVGLQVFLCRCTLLNSCVRSSVRHAFALLS